MTRVHIGFPSPAVADVSMKEWSSVARRCDEGIFDTLWHSNERFYREMWIRMSVSAMVTRSVSVGGAVVDPFAVRPLITAQSLATMAELLGGRATPALGAGGSGFPMMGIERTRSATAIREALLLIRRLLAGETVSLHGEAVSAENAMDRAVRWGAGWIPGWRPFEELEAWIGVLRGKAEAAGRDPASLIVAPQLSCLIAPTQREAERRHAASEMVRHRESLASTGRDPRLAMDNNLIGSPEVVLEKTLRLARAGVDHLACLTFCVRSTTEYEDQLRSFAEEVMEPFRRSEPP